MRLLQKRRELTLPSWFGDTGFWALFITAILLNGGIWLYIRLKYSTLPHVLAIHYAANGTVDRAGDRNQLYILPVIGLSVALANLGVSAAIYKRDTRVCQLLLVVSIMAQVFLWGAALRLVR